jgi:hypothetical protein
MKTIVHIHSDEKFVLSSKIFTFDGIDNKIILFTQNVISNNKINCYLNITM